MSNLNFKKLHFSHILHNDDHLCKVVLDNIVDKPNVRILDLGCGTGGRLFEIASLLSNITLEGLDISKENIATARQICNEKQLQKRITFHEADYVNLPLLAFDMILAESILHLIPSSNEHLFSKLSNELKPNGKLIILMPYNCINNKFLIGIRYILKFFRSQTLDTLILCIAKKIYPSWNEELLQERLEYMYMIPFRLDSKKLHRQLIKKYGIVPLKILSWPSTSIAKLKHRLVVFQKQSDMDLLS